MFDTFAIRAVGRNNNTHVDALIVASNTFQIPRDISLRDYKMEVIFGSLCQITKRIGDV